MSQREWTLASAPCLSRHFLIFLWGTFTQLHFNLANEMNIYESYSKRMVMTGNQSHPFMSPFQAKCHSSSGDTQLRGRDPGILSKLEKPSTIILSIPFILYRPRAGSGLPEVAYKFHPREGQLLCDHTLPWIQDFPARDSTHQPKVSSSVLITSIYPEHFPSRDYKPKAPPQASAPGHF